MCYVRYISLLKWYITYCNTPNIEKDMNELVGGFRWILLRLGSGHYCWIMHYGEYQMLPFDWFIYVTYGVIIRENGIIPETDLICIIMTRIVILVSCISHF